MPLFFCEGLLDATFCAIEGSSVLISMRIYIAHQTARKYIFQTSSCRVSRTYGASLQDNLHEDSHSVVVLGRILIYMIVI